MNIETKSKIEEHLREVMNRIIEKRTIYEPFNEDEIKRKNPFGYRLVPIEVWKGSKFERSFVTSLGQGIFEQIARIIAEGSGAIAINQYQKIIRLNSWQLERIDNILENQRKKNLKTKSKNSIKLKTISEELEFLRKLDTDRYQDVNVLFDLYIKRKDGTEEYYSLKTVKPNLDQTEAAKKDILRLMTSEKNAQAYFALPYNPAGEDKSYKSIHSIPYKLFDMDCDNNVLIGENLWNKIGMDDNTYSELLDIFDKVGEECKDKIRKNYLGI
ncbi:type II restriction endonuclease [Clostridium bornimense]|uniref:type II site-specific deoxyribonuclease n=1 Tax=Clostridium bornimense TaxID=1216932 RepID=W6RZH0_9CLOT|nr:TdeIII family type II restriction endonuclease [Clostridium bornimense]CDM70051.1 type II restriction endonuclease [Clostridium bornimense]